MMAVRKDWGLKKPASQTAAGSWKSPHHDSSSLTLCRRSAYHRPRGSREG